MNKDQSKSKKKKKHTINFFTDLYAFSHGLSQNSRSKDGSCEMRSRAKKGLS
jgi:hypothetical protein